MFLCMILSNQTYSWKEIDPLTKIFRYGLYKFIAESFWAMGQLIWKLTIYKNKVLVSIYKTLTFDSFETLESYIQNYLKNVI